MGIFTYFGCFSARAILSESGSFARITEQLLSLAVFIARSCLTKRVYNSSIILVSNDNKEGYYSLHLSAVCVAVDLI